MVSLWAQLRHDRRINKTQLSSKDLVQIRWQQTKNFEEFVDWSVHECRSIYLMKYTFQNNGMKCTFQNNGMKYTFQNNDTKYYIWIFL